MDNIKNTNECKKDIFEILGISSKEDCFTNLLAETFNHSGSQEFRERLCIAISNDSFNVYNSEDAIINTRYVFNVKSSSETGGRSKLVPDMIFTSHSQKVIVIIENKIFSNEGYKQTSAYSSPEFLFELRRILKEHHIEDDYKIEYYYMTLLGEKPCSYNFKPLKWTDFIIATCKDVIMNEPYNILLNDLLSRAIELKSFVETPLDINKTFMDYCSQRNRWISNKTILEKYFSLMLSTIVFKYDGQVNFLISEYHGRSSQMLILLNKDDWMKNNIEEYKQGDPISRFEHTRNIHVEFTWQVGAKDASIMIHYETNPYYPYDKFREKYPTIEPIYAEHRKAFKDNFNRAIEDSKYWKKANTTLALARSSCKDFVNITYNDFQNWFLDVFDEAYTLINNILKSE